MNARKSNKTLTKSHIDHNSEDEALLRATEQLREMHKEIDDRIRHKESHPSSVPELSSYIPIQKPKKQCLYMGTSSQSYFAPKRKLTDKQKANSITASNPNDTFSSPSPLEEQIGKPHPRLTNRK